MTTRDHVGTEFLRDASDWDIFISLARASAELDSPPVSIRSTAMKTNLKILVVDDESTMRLVVRHALAAQGHRVVTAADGEEAIRLAREESFDLILMDLLMPGTDGIEAIMTIRKEKPELRIVAMSGGWDGQRRNFLPLAARLGAIHTLAKPFGRDDLLKAVHASDGVQLIS